MRFIAVATLCALAVATPAVAQQKVERIKARGANAAGACAGSLDMLGQYMSRDPNVDQVRLSEVQQARDFFADMPRFPSSEISAAAGAFVTLMSQRIRDAQTVQERQAVQREIVKVSSGCFASAKAELQAFRRAAPGPAPTAPGTVQTVPAQPYVAQPSITQPYTTQPYTVQPYTVQPAPIQPAPVQPAPAVPPAQPFSLTPVTPAQ